MSKNTRVAAGIALACAFAAAWPSIAQEGPLRQRLRERWMERQQQKPAPEATADVGTKITRPGDYTFTIEHGGLTRAYKVHVPQRYDASRPTPLLVALHGGGGNMDYQADDANYGQIGKSEREGHIVVFPNGYSKLRSGKFATWNAGNCCGAARDQNVDDVGFIRQVVSNLSHQLNIDRERIYATGMSNGALMAYRLACEASDLFKAIAPVAGTDNTRSCQPRNPVSIVHFHARNDPNMVFTGGSGPNSQARSVVTDFVSVADSTAKWVKLNACNPTPRKVLDRPGVTCELYSPCKNDTKIELCVTETGGHSWPGAERTRKEPSSKAINANDVMWDFFDGKS